MAKISQTKLIKRLYDKVINDGIRVDENETVDNIVKVCENENQFVVDVETKCVFNFVQTKQNNRDCVRMVFKIQNNDDRKVESIKKIMTILKNAEQVLIYIDSVKIKTKGEFTFLDLIKNN